jgi:hypothetical protein
MATVAVWTTIPSSIHPKNGPDGAGRWWLADVAFTRGLEIGGLRRGRR